MAYYGVVFNNGDELLHYGVKGMKWGKKRNQSSKTSSTKKYYQKFNGPILGNYESTSPNPTSSQTYQQIYTHYNHGNGSAKVQSLLDKKAKIKIATVKVSSVAIELCQSKAPVPLKLLGLGVAVANNVINKARVKSINSKIIKDAMKKK